MSWFFGFLAAAIAFAWWFSHRRFVQNARRLAQRIDELEAEQTRLRGQTEGEEFNLRTILASMAEGVMVVNAQHVLRLVNPSFISLFAPKGDPLGQTVLQLLREPEVEEMIAAALATGEPQTR